MGEPRRSRRARIADALVWGAILGAALGRGARGRARRRTIDTIDLAGGELRTDHGFSLGGRRFLTLRYEISRVG
jgi:hypothetical protein